MDKSSIIERPANLCTDTATTESALLHANPYTDAEIIICLNACSPLVRATDINFAIDMIKAGHSDSVVSVVPHKTFGEFNQLKGESRIRPYGWCPSFRPMRQQCDQRWLEVGVLWATKRDELARSKCRISGKILPLIMPAWAVHEIDEPEDWEFMEHLLELRKAGKI